MRGLIREWQSRIDARSELQFRYCWHCGSFLTRPPLPGPQRVLIMEFGKRANAKFFHFFVGNFGGAWRYGDWARRWTLGPTTYFESFAIFSAFFHSCLARETLDRNTTSETASGRRTCRSVR